MSERRRFPRYRYQGAATLTVGDEGAAQPVTVVSLSIDGGRLLGDNLPSRGTRCRLLLEDQGKELGAECEITWHGKGIAGIRFVALDAAGTENLREICKGLSLEPLQPPKPFHE